MCVTMCLVAVLRQTPPLLKSTSSDQSWDPSLSFRRHLMQPLLAAASDATASWLTQLLSSRGGSTVSQGWRQAGGSRSAG